MTHWWLVILFCVASLGAAPGLDRDAFTITEYRLNVMIDRNTHVMAIDGSLTLRNDSKSTQKNLALQVSSSFKWDQIRLGDQSLGFLAEDYTSDLDHTGSLSEAIVSLPNPVPVGGAITLEVRYGGAVIADATRLTRIGAPQDVAVRNDWDQISEPFTAVRGLGYVVWYPIAIEAVSMSDGSAVSDAIARWKERHGKTEFFVYLGVATTTEEQKSCIASNATAGSGYWRVGGAASAGEKAADQESAQEGRELYGVTLQRHGMQDFDPVFAMFSSCDTLTRTAVEITFIPEHSLIAKDYAAGAESNEQLLNEWFPVSASPPIRIIELADPDATPYQAGTTLFAPLRSSTQQNLQLLLLPAQVTARFPTPRPWMQNGLGFFLQAINDRGRGGKDVALQFLDRYQDPLAKTEELTHPAKTTDAASPPSESDNTLLNTTDEIYLRVKSGYVFWMLNDMLGESALQHALAAYHADKDKEPGYFQKLLEAETKRDLEWFFDDWVYRDRGLPDFRVESASSRKILSGNADSYQVTAIIENRGGAGAEVPVVVQTASGAKTVRVLVKAHGKGVGRIDVPSLPTRVVVNDGSVPEFDTSNNIYELETKTPQ